MPTVEVCNIINADRGKVFEVIKNMEIFPKFMRDVKTVKVLEYFENRIVTEWVTNVDGVPIQWIEEDIFNDREMSCNFKTLKGDYKYDGVWKVASLKKNKTRLSILVNFDWQIPNFEKFIGYILEKKARNSLRSMLNAIKKKVENG